MSVFLVPEALAGERVDVVAARITGHSRSRIAELISEGGVLLDGVPVTRASRSVTAQAMLELVTAPRPDHVVVQPRLADGLAVVHQDNDIVVVDKPAGVAAHPSLGWDGPSVTEHLAAAGITIATSGAPERQGVVSRLDVGTSGLMVLARSEQAYSVLKQAFRDKTVDKTYQALVQGHPDPFVGTIDAPIGRHPGHEWKMAVVQGGRESVTHYEALEAHRAATLLEVSLETGRTHQIRVHMAAIGHPCCGDPLYGGDPELARRLGLDRQWLHATELGFQHPVSREWVSFGSPLPPDLAEALRVVQEG
ncbi:MAG: RluA family pseudouridine synthase [Arachnia propionica]|uniref:RluA family pseudouridine synthase n=1 Tax=Arachnia propionica TaxID=1750 RepID=UPI00270A0809|nr:RluA family pseudouridine synthase [Arachnia propionica]